MNYLEELIAVEQFMKEIDKQKKAEKENYEYMRVNMMDVLDRALENSSFKKGTLTYNDLQENVVVSLSVRREYDDFEATVVHVMNDRWGGKIAKIIAGYEDDCGFYYISHSFNSWEI